MSEWTYHTDDNGGFYCNPEYKDKYGRPVRYVEQPFASVGNRRMRRSMGMRTSLKETQEWDAELVDAYLEMKREQSELEELGETASEGSERSEAGSDGSE